jgi:hypothetical protein
MPAPFIAELVGDGVWWSLLSSAVSRQFAKKSSGF